MNEFFYKEFKQLLDAVLETKTGWIRNDIKKAIDGCLALAAMKALDKKGGD